jgi:hypothetical protein
MVAKMMLGGQPMLVNPSDIKWNFRMKFKDWKCLGGKVIQVYGTVLDDITINGAYSVQRHLGQKDVWEEQMRFRDQVERWADRAVDQSNTDPLRFFYAPRKWDFQVYIKSISIIDWKVEDFAPKWTLVLYPMDDRATHVVRGIKDLYIKRLMDGIGWKQTDYNGPTQQEVDDELAGRSVEEYVAAGLGEAYEQGTQGTGFGPT